MTYVSGPMTESMYYVLLALHSPGHGYQLMNDVKELSGGRIHMGPGTLYGVLTRMLKDELILIVKDDGRRKTYELTDSGHEALQNEFQRLNTLVTDGRSIGLKEE